MRKDKFVHKKSWKIKKKRMEETKETTIGSELIHDIFVRADKNEDGKIQIEEFDVYFDDPVLGKEDLKELFDSIDSDSNQ